MKVANDWRYPAAQIAPNGEVIAGLSDILEATRDLSSWAVLDFLLADDAPLSGASPLKALH